jgi:hypothetical protein
MPHLSEEEKCIKVLALHLNRYFYEGNSNLQTYSFKNVFDLITTIGCKPKESDNYQFLIDHLRSWNEAGYIHLNEQDRPNYIEIINPAFLEIES